MAEPTTTPDEALALHSHRGTRAIQRLVEYAPSTGGLALWVAHHDRPPAPEKLESAVPEPLLRTDGRTLHYSNAFQELSVPQQAGLVAHAVLHIALRHTQRYTELQQLLGDVDLQLFNTCADAIVNSALRHLGWLQLPAQAVMLDRLLSRALRLEVADDVALMQWDVESLYRAIDDRGSGSRVGDSRNSRSSRNSQAGGHGDAQGQSPSSQAHAQADQSDAATAAAPQSRRDGPAAAMVRALGNPLLRDLLPGAAGDQTPEDEAEQSRLWSERLQRAHAGDGERSLLRVLLADLQQDRTPWEQVLRTQLAQALAPQRSLSWSRPSRSYLANQGRSGRRAGVGAVARRIPFEPGLSSVKRVPQLVVVVDVSGSIEADLLARFAREIEAITRRLEAGLTLVIGDQCVRTVTRYEPGRGKLRDIVFEGGGGTDFTPLLEEAARHQPDSVVVLTDLDGPARFRPRCPVIWAVPSAAGTGLREAPQAPFGRVLML